jgi:hypothetical protein
VARFSEKLIPVDFDGTLPSARAFVVWNSGFNIPGIRELVGLRLGINGNAALGLTTNVTCLIGVIRILYNLFSMSAQIRSFFALKQV